jgi:hypothetical protein
MINSQVTWFDYNLVQRRIIQSSTCSENACSLTVTRGSATPPAGRGGGEFLRIKRRLCFQWYAMFSSIARCLGRLRQSWGFVGSFFEDAPRDECACVVSVFVVLCDSKKIIHVYNFFILQNMYWNWYAYCKIVTPDFPKKTKCISYVCQDQVYTHMIDVMSEISININKTYRS